MIDRALDGVIGAVTRHNVAVVLVVLAITVGMVGGIGNADIGDSDGFTGSVDTTVDEKETYVERHYPVESGVDEDPGAPFPVFVKAEDGNALSKDALIATLEYQKAATDDDTVEGSMTDDEVLSIASLVGATLAQGSDATLEERTSALEAADEDEVADAVAATIEGDPTAQLLLPESYEPGTATAESTQIVFTFEPAEDGEAPVDAQESLHERAQEEALHETSPERDAPEFFVLGEPALQEMSEIELENTLFLVLPLVLGLILVVAAFAYRDVVDVFVGVLGVVVSIVWMFGLLGWLGIEVGTAVVIGPVLIAGLSIDYGFHVFTRYREERREDEPVGPPMARGLRAVTTAFALVTVTAGVGFLSNLANPVGELRDLGVGITFGVVSAFVIFVTLVPALKVSIDGGLERLGICRDVRPLGDGSFVGPALSGSVTLARRAAPVVIVLAVLLTAGGAVGWTALDEEPLPGPSDDVADWKADLPGPVGWEENDPLQRQVYVGEQFVVAQAEDDHRVQILVEGDVTADGTLAATEAGVEAGFDRGAFATGQADTIERPTTVIDAAAAEDEAFAATVEEADTTGDGIPDSDLETVFDELYEVDPEGASQVIERQDGEYRSLRVVGPPEASGGFEGTGDEADDHFAVEDAIEEEGDGLTATVVSDATSEQAAIELITEGIVRVMLVALGVVFLTLVVSYRLVHESATLGAVTAAPVGFVLGFVAAGMYVLTVPLNFLTVLLVSLVIGIGIDYAIHLSDRFALELDDRDPLDALETAVRGTGGALLGSMLTSVSAFAGMLVHPGPDFQDFATLVILAMVAAFVAAVVVLPSMLYVWSRHLHPERSTAGSRSQEGAVTRD